MPILKSFQTNPFRLSSAKKNLGSAIVPSTTLRAFPIIKLEAPSRKQTCYAATKNQEGRKGNSLMSFFCVASRLHVLTLFLLS